MGDVIHVMTGKGHNAGRMLGQVGAMCKRFPELYGRDPLHILGGIKKAFFTLQKAADVTQTQSPHT